MSALRYVSHFAVAINRVPMSFAVNLVSIIVCCAVAWASWRWSKVKKYWAQRGVPHVPPHPIFGSLTFLQKINPALWMREIYGQFKTPYVGIWLFWRPALVVNSPEIGHNILVKDSAIFRNRFLGSGPTDPFGHLNIFTVNDPLWSDLRRRLNSTFTPAKLRSSEHYMRSKAKELEQRVKMEVDKPVELKGLYTDYTTDIIGTTAFGVSCNATLTGDGPIRSITKEFAKYSVFRGLSWCSIFFLPELVDVFRFKFFPKSATEYFRNIIRVVAAEREANINKWGEGNDLLETLLKMRRENDYSEDFVVAQASAFLLGGNDTSGSVLSFITYELAHYPEVQDKLYQELIEAKQKHGDDLYNYSAISELTYFNCVIKESLRKHSPMSWLDRVATCDYKVDDKLTIKAGTPVYVNGTGMHYDPAYFPDPYKFCPERFLPENVANIKSNTYMPFGSGPRICIGARFGMMTMGFALVFLFLNYKAEPYPGSPKPVDVKIENRGMFYMPGEPLYVKFVSRDPYHN